QAHLAPGRRIGAESLLEQLGLADVATTDLVLCLGVQLLSSVLDSGSVVPRLPQRSRATPNPSVKRTGRDNRCAITKVLVDFCLTLKERLGAQSERADVLPFPGLAGNQSK